LNFHRKASEGYCDSSGRCRDASETRAGQRYCTKFRKYFVDTFMSSRNPPWFDARGVAVGLFIGLGIPLGIQMIVLGLLRLLFRFNTIVAFACTWVNNPFSVIPMYYGYYCLGSLMLGKPAIMSAEDFQSLMLPILHADYFWVSVQAFLYLGCDMVVRWVVAALTVSAACGVIGYVASFRLWRRGCKKNAKQLGITYEKLLSELESAVEKIGKGQN